MQEEQKYPYLSQCLQKNKMQVRLTVYCSGMSGFVANIHRPFSTGFRDSWEDEKGELIADARGDTLEECLGFIDMAAKNLLEMEEGIL